MSHLHYDHAGGAHLFPKAELVVQRDEYSYANYPASFFEPFYYRKNFDLPGYRWRLLDGDTELAPGSDRAAHRRPHPRSPVAPRRSCRRPAPCSSPAMPATGWSTPSASGCPAWCGTRRCALHSIKKIKTLARLIGARIFPGHDPSFWKTVRQAPDSYR